MLPANELAIKCFQADFFYFVSLRGLCILLGPNNSFFEEGNTLRSPLTRLTNYISFPSEKCLSSVSNSISYSPRPILKQTLWQIKRFSGFSEGLYLSIFIFVKPVPCYSRALPVVLLLKFVIPKLCG